MPGKLDPNTLQLWKILLEKGRMEMVLNRIRNLVQPILEKAGYVLGNWGITPHTLTVLGFVLGVFAGFWYALRPGQEFIAGLLIVGAGILDVLDGAVARATNKVTTMGSLHDSILDRLSETAIYAGIIYAGYGVSPVIVMLTASFSLVISYLRAKGESLSIRMSGVGVGERAERLLVLIIFSLAGFVWIGIYIILVLAIVTLFQRYIFLVHAGTRGTGASK